MARFDDLVDEVETSTNPETSTELAQNNDETPEEVTVSTDTVTDAPVIQTEASEPSTEVSETPAATENQAPEPGEAEQVAQAASAQPEQAKPEEKPIDLDSFIAKVNEAADGAAAGGQPTEDGIKSTQDAYQTLDGAKAKSAARGWVQAEMIRLVKSKEMERAIAITLIGEHLTEGKAKKASTGEGTPKKAADPTEAYVSQRVVLDLARTLLGENKPEGVADDADDQADTKFAAEWDSAQAYFVWVNADKESRGDEPEASDLVKTGAKLASGKKTKTTSGGGGTSTPFTGTRGDIGAHIAEAFANEPSGKFLKVADIGKFKSTAYGDRKPSPGAISSRLQPGKSLPEGITATKQDGVLGAVKA